MNTRSMWETELRRRDVAATSARVQAPSKHRNQPVMVDGHRFASGREAEYYGELKIRLAAGEIAKLARQVSFDLHTLTPTGQWVKVGRFTPDFCWTDVKTGKEIICDVKSPSSRTEAYQCRKRHFEAETGREVMEVE